MGNEPDFKAYVKKGGISCPYCGCEDVFGGFLEVDAGTASQEVICNGCEKRWRDIYTLTRAEEIE